jgi:bile acid-coenzyme A ligase
MQLSWSELAAASSRFAWRLREKDVDDSSLVVIGLKNGLEHYIAAHASWRLGALVLPLSHRIPAAERAAIVRLAKPAVVVADWEPEEFAHLTADDVRVSKGRHDAALPDVIADPGKAMGSGGATGRPKIIVTPGPFAWAPGDLVTLLEPITGFKSGQVQLVAGPLYHNSPFVWGNFGLFEDHSLVLFERFNAARVVDAIEQYRVSFGFFSPTMMQRIVQLPDVRSRDFSSFDSMFHSAAPCPQWVKRAWMDLLGPERVNEGFGSTENHGTVWIRGDEWLLHPGSVGKPRIADLRILDDQGNEVPAGEVGEIFMRPGQPGASHYYIGAPPAKGTTDNFMSMGDLGWVDEEGYLYVADRRVDLIISGGANVFPAEVEAALSSHPEVADVAVIGLPDSAWGKRVHAIIQPHDPAQPPSKDELRRHARERLVPYKAPKTYEFVVDFPRDPSGKLRRSQLVQERCSDS